MKAGRVSVEKRVDAVESVVLGLAISAFLVWTLQAKGADHSGLLPAFLASWLFFSFGLYATRWVRW